jgi:hypothetical protein
MRDGVRRSSGDRCGCGSSWGVGGRKLLRVAFAVCKGTEVFDPTRLVPKTP